MTVSILSGAEEGAIPPGLAGEAAALVDPGEGFLWVGRGRSGATFAASWPVAILPAFLLGGMLWLWLGYDGGFVATAPGTGKWPVRMGGMAYLPIALIGGASAWILLRFAHHVATASRNIFVLTPRRVIVRSGRRSETFPLAQIAHAVAAGPEHRRSLSFRVIRDEGGRSRPGPTLSGATNADAAVEVLKRLEIAVRDERPEREGPDERPSGIRPGEMIGWSGRRGIGSIGRSRVMLAVFCAPLPLPLLIILWFIWSSHMSKPDGVAVMAAGFMSFVVCLIFGPMAWVPLSHAPAFFRDIFVDVFGTLAVTDRRIAFLAPLTGRVDREIRAERLVEAALVLVDDRGRGHISLTLKPKKGEEAEHMDLYAVPDPENAVAAMARLIPSS